MLPESKLRNIYLTAKETHNFHCLFFNLNNIILFDSAHTLVPGNFIPRNTVNQKFFDNVKTPQKVLRALKGPGFESEFTSDYHKTI